MRKFSTFHGLFTKTPTHALPHDTTPQPTSPNISPQSLDDDTPTTTPTLSVKAVQCYKSLHDHDKIVRNLLQQSKPH